MAKRSKYNTKHRQAVMDCLSRLKGKHATVSYVWKYMQDCGIEIGKTTVYRQLERLVEEGVAHKYTTLSGSANCYEYVGKQQDSKREYHCKCERCGKLIHIECEEVETLQEHMEASHGFYLDAPHTLFMGLCDKCSQGK